jgi:hypothetical protein
VAAPEIALPAGALGLLGAAVRIVGARRRSVVGQPSGPRQVVRHDTVREVPVVVATDSPIPPARVVETNHYVPIEIDIHRKSWTWASKEYVRKYPGSEGMVAALAHMMSQYDEKKEGA